MNRLWKLAEERTLVEMWKAGAASEDIGDSLGRSCSSVDNYIHRHRMRLGLDLRRARWHRAELLLVAREVEMAIQRMRAGTPHRSRASINQHIVSYLYGDAQRRRRKEVSARITDLGGMAVMSSAGREFGTVRAEKSKRRRPRGIAA